MTFLRYFLVGGTAAALDLVIFVIFAKWAGFNYLLVAAAGFMLATCLNYLLSVRFVFKSGARFGRRQEVLAVYLVSKVGLLIHQAVLYACVEFLLVELVASKIVATGTVFAWNYLARATFVFRAIRSQG